MKSMLLCGIVCALLLGLWMFFDVLPYRHVRTRSIQLALASQLVLAAIFFAAGILGTLSLLNSS